MNNLLKIRNFTINEDLGFLIQETTKANTEEVISHFYGLTKEIVDYAANKFKDTERSHLNRELKTVYPGTAIPFRLTVWGRVDTKESEVTVHVDFSKSKNNISVDHALQSILEHSLLGAPLALEKFPAPIRKAPAGLKRLKS